MKTQALENPALNNEAKRSSAVEHEPLMCGCSQPNDLHRRSPRSEPQNAPFDYEAAGFGPDGAEIEEEAVSSISLARVNCSNGAQIDFSAIDEGDGRHGIAMREIGDTQRVMPSVLQTLSSMSPLEVYSKLNPSEPIPRLIAALSNSKSVKNLVDVVTEPLNADLDELGILTQVQLSGASGDGGFGGHFCVSGDGWHAFKNFACNGSGPGNAWTWCDPSVAYNWRDRWTSGHKRKNSFGVTATCGAPAETRHYYRNAFGNWKKLKTWYLPNQHWQWTRYEGASKRDRWVRHLSSIQGAPSFVRSLTSIYT